MVASACTPHKLAARIDKLPSLPDVVVNVRETIADSKSSAADLAKAIERDPPIAARVLRLANSGAFCRGAKVVDLRQAVNRLGAKEIENAVVAASLASTFGVDGDETLSKLYIFGLTAAAAAGVITRRRGGWFRKRGNPLFIHALLHDIGLFALHHLGHVALPETAAAHPWQKIREIEKESIGFGHDELGALLLQRWRLAPSVVQCARWHHEPDEADEEHVDAVCTVSLASAVSAEILDSAAYRLMSPDSCALARHRLGLSEEDVEAAVEETRAVRSE